MKEAKAIGCIGLLHKLRSSMDITVSDDQA